MYANSFTGGAAFAQSGAKPAMSPLLYAVGAAFAASGTAAEAASSGVAAASAAAGDLEA